MIVRQILLFGVSALTGIGMMACTGSYRTLAPPSPTSAYIGAPGMPAINTHSKNFAVASDPRMPIAIARPKLSSSHTYTLPELINIAQLSSPTTRAAWERARVAAAAAGVAEAAYLPLLTAEVLAGFAVVSATAPGFEVGIIDVPTGTITTTGAQAAPSVAIQWLLFDFGSRDAALATALELSFAANVGFNGSHQKLIFDVANAYYQNAASQAQTRINSETLDNARLVLTAAEARRKQGIGTTMDVTQAEQQVAQAEFDLTEARGQERNTYAALLGAMGLSPTITIKVQDLGGKRLPKQVPGDLDRLIVASLKRRADVQAAFAELKASEQGILAAEAEFLPKVALSASANALFGSYSVHDSRFGGGESFDTVQPNAALLLGLTVPIFDGGMREARLSSARSTAAASAFDFSRLQTTAAQEIVIAYDVLRTSLTGYTAATALVTAARTNYEAALEYYRTGLGTQPDVSVAQTGLLKAQYAQAQARSNAFTAAATLAFATGTLTSAHGL